jgi:hypothetical protein
MSRDLRTLTEVKALLPHIFGDDESLDVPVVHQALAYIREEAAGPLHFLWRD